MQMCGPGAAPIEHSLQDKELDNKRNKDNEKCAKI